jgi:hypothetical protein
MKTEPKSRPILFSAAMVRALLNGTKTQTRRIVKPQPPANACHWKECSAGQWLSRDYGQQWKCPQGVAGDTLWVKETWAAQLLKLRTVKPTEIPNWERINYAADHTADDMDGLGPWRPSLFMRRWMSRITLEIVSVRLERLQDISEADAVAEGCAATYSLAGYNVLGSGGSIQFVVEEFVGGIPKAGDDWQGMTVEHVQHVPARVLGSARDEYRRLWTRINGPGSWQANPWVWCVSFRRVKL